VGVRVKETAIDSFDPSGLPCLSPALFRIAGTPCEGMTICSAGKVLGRLHGFVVDPMGTQLRYLVVRTSGLLERTRLVPFDAARVDIENRSIEVPVESYA
jgi:hypothetical protein